MLLVNDAISGGSDGSERTAIASIGLVNICAMKLADVMAGLGDEY